MSLLSSADFLAVVRHAPLVAMDLLVRDREGRMLLGQRVNPPARGFWFAPGGRIRKGEMLDQAFQRIALSELGGPFVRAQASLAGVHEHFYQDDFSGGDAGTHYVVLAYALDGDAASLRLPTDQHDAWRWVGAEGGRDDPSIHMHTRAYF